MIHHQTERVTLHHGDCLDVLRELPDCSVDAVVTDPPYGLEFMGKEWDSFGRDSGPGYQEKPRFTDRGNANPLDRTSGPNHFRAGAPFQRWCEQWTAECLRVLKPGGHMLAFGGTRTWHRLAVAVEDAGFEIRDSLAWCYATGFPKSMDVSKAIDQRLGAERVVTRQAARPLAPGEVISFDQRSSNERERRDDAATPAAAAAAGWGTALKPAYEPVVVARKPLDGTVAANWLAHGTGALNIDGCRIGSGGGPASAPDATPNRLNKVYGDGMGGLASVPLNAGRWPANLLLDEHEARALDLQSGELTSGLARTGERAQSRGGEIYGKDSGYVRSGDTYGDSGGASRFFYVAKAGSNERPRAAGVAHPTVKPLALMRWLVRLVTPPGGTVLEPFAGNGTTVAAAILEGFDCIAIEREADYLPLIVSRIERPLPPESAGAAPKVAADQLDVFAALDEEAV